MIKASRAYPPRSNQELRNLYKQIISSTSPNHHKQSLIYYILRDCRNAGDSAAQFARDCYLPEKYRLFIDGIWHLDRLDFRVYHHISYVFIYPISAADVSLLASTRISYRAVVDPNVSG